MGCKEKFLNKGTALLLLGPIMQRPTTTLVIPRLVGDKSKMPATHYQKAIEIRPDLVGAHYNLGVVLTRRGQIDDAIAHFRKALEIQPGHTAAGRNLEVLLRKRP